MNDYVVIIYNGEQVSVPKAVSYTHLTLPTNSLV